MKATQADPLLRDIHLLFRAGAAGGLTDGELLERFVARRDEVAFEVLVHRLGPMVLGVCRRMLRDRHDAEDAFQATFLVLARRASAIDPPERVGPWLYGVARHVASRARATIARRRSRETSTPIPPEIADDAGMARDDFLPLLDLELGRLPEKYRAPIVLCHLEGKPYKEAARQLGLREGTFSGRLTRGRALLAARLTRRGAAMSAGALAVFLTKDASAMVPTSLAASAAAAATGFRVGASAVVAVSAEVAALTKKTLRAMLMTKLRVTSLALATVGMVGVGVAAGGRDEPKSPEGAARDAEAQAPILLQRPGGPIDGSQITYERIGPGARKITSGDGFVVVDRPESLTDAGPMKPVEAYRIGDDLYINVAPPGSGRVLLEKVKGQPRSDGQDRNANKDASAPTDGARKGAAQLQTGLPVRAEEKPAAPPGKTRTAPLPTARSRRSTAANVPQVTTARERVAASTRYFAFTDGPAGLDDDAFIRRVYLEILGRAPTREEIEAFARDDSPEKRGKLVGRLVDDPAFVERAKSSTKQRLVPPTPAAQPVRFAIEAAVLDRVDVEHGNRIDVHMAHGLDYAPTDRASAHAIYGLRDGRLVTTVIPPATRLQAVPVAVEAHISIKSEDGSTFTGTGDKALAALKPGMRLSLRFVAEGAGLTITEIQAQPAGAAGAGPKAESFNFEIGRTR